MAYKRLGTPAVFDRGSSLQGARFVDATNGAGLTALHLATLNGSAATVRACLMLVSLHVAI